MKEVKEYLLSNIDKKYLDFSENLNICKGIRALGVRIPVLRSLAKSLSKEYTINYLNSNGVRTINVNDIKWQNSNTAMILLPK